jgi:hypothetical protein
LLYGPVSLVLQLSWFLPSSYRNECLSMFKSQTSFTNFYYKPFSFVVSYMYFSVLSVKTPLIWFLLSL